MDKINQNKLKYPKSIFYSTMHQEKYSLTWHTYSDHLRSMMKELMMNEDFSDITLVTEDKKHIKANINILSTCSPVFKDILKKEKSSNHIMYLRGVQYSEIESIMQFIYLGEATFYKERMDEFLAVAKSLEIKELYNAKTVMNDELSAELLCDQVISTENLEEQTVISDSGHGTLHKQKLTIHQGVKYACDQCDYQATTQSNLTVHIKSKHEGVKYACNQCNYQATQKSSLTVHIKSIHEGVKYACEQCDYQATQLSSLAVHIKSKHEGVKYACDQCDYQATQQPYLTRHIQSKHESVKYACDQCDYQGTVQSNLSVHIKSNHESVKYACNQCDYKATKQSHLNAHIQSKHEGVKYVCDQCDYQATQQSCLTKHIQSKHEGVRYACDQCNYNASWRSVLRRHKRVNHQNK